MPEKFVCIRHHVDDYECMWNGIEDLYMTRTGEELPGFFFFAMAGVGNFIYLRTPGAAIKRFAAWNDGRTEKMYERLAPIAGFRYRHMEGTSFLHMLKRAKQNIDAGRPVVLGCLDMYYLAYYPKFYHREHIPIHYVLMVGYDNEKESVYVLDCGTSSIQELSYACLEDALNIQKTDLSDKNGMYAIQFEDKPPGVREIAVKALAEKARNMLQPPVSFIGIRGMRKLAKEFAAWKDELAEEEYQTALRNIVTFTGTVPILPDALLKPAERNGIQHRAGREQLVRVLDELSTRYDIAAWEQSAREFEKSGGLLSQMTVTMTDYLMNNRSELIDIPEIIECIADDEERAFALLLEGAAR